LFGGRDNRLCSLWYSIGLGVHGLWVSMFDVFWVLFGVVFLGGGYFGLRYPLLCVCVRSLAHLVYLQERKKHFNKQFS